MNLHRRHLSQPQRATAAAKAKDWYAAKARKRQAHGKTAPGKTLKAKLPEASAGQSRDQAGKQFKVSGKSVDHATKVLEDGVPELIRAVENDQADKVAYAFCCNYNRRHCTPAQKKKARDGMKKTCLTLLKQGDIQKVAAAKLGIGRSTVSDWIKATKPHRSAPNVGSGNRRTPDQRRKLTPAQEEEIKELLASGKTQATVAANLGVSRQHVSTIANRNGKPKKKKKKPKTISGCALAVREEVANGAPVGPTGTSHSRNRETARQALWMTRAYSTVNAGLASSVNCHTKSCGN